MKRKDSGKRPTIYSLAEMAAVSPGTVSRVLNNRDKVKPATRAKILKLAQEIGMKPQSAVRSRKIAVITEPHYTDRFYGYSNVLTSHVAFALSEQDVGMLLPMDPVKQLPHYFIDGIVAISYDHETADALKKMEKKIPVVYLDNFEADEGQYVVYSDHVGSGYKAAKCFLDNGRKSPAFIGGPDTPFRVRLKGFRSALEEAGVSQNERLYAPIAAGESLYHVVNRAVKNGADALYVPGASMQVIEALHVLTGVMQLRVPEDVSLIGGENPGISSFLNPPLTTLMEPLSEMAKTAVDMVLKLSDGEKIKSRQVMFPTELIERDSVQ